MSDDDIRNARLKRKNWTLFAILIGFAALMFAITIIKIKLYTSGHR